MDWTLTDDVDRMIVALGGNDMLRGLSPEEARANLDGILTAADAKGVEVLLVGLEAPGNYGQGYKDAFAAAYADLAEAYGALLLPDLFAPIRDLPSGEVMQRDGVHPNATGVAAIPTLANDPGGRNLPVCSPRPTNPPNKKGGSQPTLPVGESWRE